MKPKMIQLLMLFLMISLFSSSKENAAVKVTCKFSCAKEAASTVPEAEAKVMTEEASAEYPFALAPGSYVFRY
jgi:hypothetical protein